MKPRQAGCGALRPKHRVSGSQGLATSLSPTSGACSAQCPEVHGLAKKPGPSHGFSLIPVEWAPGVERHAVHTGVRS